MNRIIALGFAFIFAIVANAQVKYPAINDSGDSNTISSKISNAFFPVIGVWVWGQQNLEPDGYKEAIDGLHHNSPFNLIVPFLRFHDKEVLDLDVYNQVKLAAEYAKQFDIGFLPDIDIRSARRAFKEQYPNELQQMLRLKRVDLAEFYRVQTSVVSIKKLYDHYGGAPIPDYDAIESDLVKIYAYRIGPNGIVPETLQDITEECRVLSQSEDSISVELPAFGRRDINQACVMVNFTLLYPDVFAPNLLKFQREILEKYSDIPLPGACKDEWGFPPYYPRYHSDIEHDFWYSPHMAKVYSEVTQGRNLAHDCLLMAFGFKGREVERQVAINSYMNISYQRNVAIEEDFYNAVKEYFGSNAVVTVHPTWWPYPDFNEMKKNGLNWWAVKRDWAQTDEVVPFGVRTALSKKWNSPLWYHMYYTAGLPDQVWSSTLAGGRIMYLRYYSLYQPDIMRAENRIRLLNYISESPMDCQVAVIFGHTSAMNWAGPSHDDVGMSIIDTLWYSGYPADLIPTSEIANGSLKVDDEGWITYGPQRYSAVVLYNPEFEGEATEEFFKKASNGQTALFRMGQWTRNFRGEPVDQNRSLPSGMLALENLNDAFVRITSELEFRNIDKQTPATALLDTNYYRLRGFNHTSYFMPNTGYSNLIDGTRIIIGGSNDIGGDPIIKEFTLKGQNVSIDAIGVVGIRLDGNGEVDALVASDLKSIQTETLTIELENRLDIALWKILNGEYSGVIQVKEEIEIPQELLKITENWTFLLLPEPPEREIE